MFVRLPLGVTSPPGSRAASGPAWRTGALVMSTIAETSPPAAPVKPVPSAALMWALLGVVLVADAMDLLDATVTTIAAPTIAVDLGGGPALIKWLSAAYALALGTL